MYGIDDGESVWFGKCVFESILDVMCYWENGGLCWYIYIVLIVVNLVGGS